MGALSVYLMEYARQDSYALEEMLAEYEARMETALEWEMEDRGEEIYYTATALVEMINGLEEDLDPERLESLNDSLEEFEEKYLEYDEDNGGNELEVMDSSNNQPPAL